MFAAQYYYLIYNYCFFLSFFLFYNNIAKTTTKHTHTNGESSLFSIWSTQEGQQTQKGRN